MSDPKKDTPNDVEVEESTPETPASPQGDGDQTEAPADADADVKSE